MNQRVYRIRPFEPRDYPDEARIQSRVDPETIFTPEEIRHFDENLFAPPMTHFKVVAEERSQARAIGFGYLSSDIESFDPQTFWVGVVVDPSHQGRGVGIALAAEIGLEAERRHARRLWAVVRVVDDRAVRFLNQQGFSERHRAWRSSLDLSTATVLPDRTQELTREGFSFTTLARENLESPELLRELYDLTNATSADEPRLGEYTPITFEQFVQRDLRGPAFLPDAYFLARYAERLVALSVLWRANGEADALRQAFTGTRREFRGRGIATELKRRSVEYGRAHGYRRIRTGNDSRNSPMLAINRKLGFRPEVALLVAERNLGGEPFSGGKPGLEE